MGCSSFRVIAVFVGLAMFLPATAVPAAAEPPPSPPEADILPTPLNGEQAIAALGGNLAATAQRNGKSAEQLADALRRDPSIFVDRGGRLLVKDTELPSPGPAADAPGRAPFPNTQTFTLHSKPGSNRVIFLDFDGATVSGTAWNANFPLPNGSYGGFDLDGKPTSWSQAEHDAIQDIFLRVAEDYSAFDVDVTTQDPGAAAIERSSSSDARYGTVALISNSRAASQVLCNDNCGGIAYLGAFDVLPNRYRQPAWVFSHMLQSNSKYIAECASHEVGHNLGLLHDGTPSEEYYWGHNGWAPIMGVGYNRPVVQFSKGEYTGATRTEDDLAVIRSHGLEPRLDEAGGTVSTASPLGGAATGGGVISSAPDVDVFSITRTCSRSTTIQAKGSLVSPNLDVKLRLLGPSGQVLASSDPPMSMVSADKAGGLDASVTKELGAGTYFVEISGVGFGTASTGYTDYGSIGQYSLTISGCPDTTAPTLTGRSPAVDATGVAAGSVVSATFDEAVSNVTTTTFTVRNAASGAAVAGAVTRTGTTNQWVFDPNADLAAGTRYTATLTGGASGIRDLVGNAFGGATWSFTTATGRPTEFVGFTPVRAADTRSGLGVRAGVIPAGGTLQVPLAGRLGVPSDAKAVSVNVTVVTPGARGGLVLFPCGAAKPGTVAMKYEAGVTLSNAALSKLGSGGAVCIAAETAVHVVVDVNGYFPAGSAFVGLTPVRAADTRSGLGVRAGVIPAGGTLQVPLAGRLGVPSDAKAVSVNVTVVTPGARGGLVLFPCGAAKPGTVAMKYEAGVTLSNAALSKLGSGGAVCIAAETAVHVVVDLNGYYPAGSAV